MSELHFVRRLDSLRRRFIDLAVCVVPFLVCVGAFQGCILASQLFDLPCLGPCGENNRSQKSHEDRTTRCMFSIILYQCCLVVEKSRLCTSKQGPKWPAALEEVARKSRCQERYLTSELFCSSPHHLVVLPPIYHQLMPLSLTTLNPSTPSHPSITTTGTKAQ